MRTVSFALFSLGLTLAHIEDECTDWKDWRDDFGWSCKDYKRVSVCDVPSQAGLHTAFDACCHCEGGTREPSWSRRRLSVLSDEALRECRRECDAESRSCRQTLPNICTEQNRNCERNCRDTGAPETCSIAGASSCLICVDGILTPDQEPTAEPSMEGGKGGGGGSDFPLWWLLLLLIPLCCIPLCILLYCMMRPVEEGGQCPPQEIPQDECDEPCDNGCASPMVGGCASGDCEPMIPATQMVGMNGNAGGYGGYVAPNPGYGVQQAPTGYGPPGY